MSYDGLGRNIITDNTTTSGNRRYSYLSGNRISVNDDVGNVTTTTYQAYGSPSYDLATRIASPEGVVTQMTYNVFDNVTSITQGGVTESRVYDTYQQLCKTVRPDVGNTAYAYDGAGRFDWEGRGIPVRLAVETSLPIFLQLHHSNRQSVHHYSSSFSAQYVL